MKIEEVTKEWLEEQYQTKSYEQIAKELGTYQMKVVRIAKKFGIKSKSHSDAQSQYLIKTDNHPTRGKQRSDETKRKISRNQTIANLMASDEQIQAKKQRARDRWNQKTDQEKKEMCQKAVKGSHRAAKEGSRLEKFLIKQLTLAGYKAEQHREEVLPSGRMHLDIFIPSLNTVIEINGIAHYRPVWGEEVLQRTRASDKEKQGLLLVAGFAFIEIVDMSDRISFAQMQDIWDQLKTILLKISSTHLKYHERYFIVKTRFNNPEKMSKVREI